MRGDRPPAGSGNTRLALGALAMSPALVATYAHAAIRRRQYASAGPVSAALAALGLDEYRDRPIEVKPLGSGKSNAVVLVDGTLVLKRALPFGTMMAWGARHFGANFVYASDTSGSARITREADALRFLARSGVAVPEVIAASPQHGLLAIAFVHGDPAATAMHGEGGVELAREVGALFRRVHDLRVTLADGHPGNMLVERASRRLVLFDLEFAELDSDSPARRGFDIAYASVLLPTDVHVRAMLDGYGSRTDEDIAAAEIAEQHLRRFRRLLEMERDRWRPQR